MIEILPDAARNQIRASQFIRHFDEILVELLQNSKINLIKIKIKIIKGVAGLEAGAKCLRCRVHLSDCWIEVWDDGNGIEPTCLDNIAVRYGDTMCLFKIYQMVLFQLSLVTQQLPKGR